MRTSLLLLLTLLCLTEARANEMPGIDIGQALYTSSALGSNHKSCQQCHPDGMGLDKTGTYDDATLKEIINFCIRDALQGEMFDPESQELASLLLYVRSLAAR